MSPAKIHSSGLLLTLHGVQDITHASRCVNAMHDDRSLTLIPPAVTTCITCVPPSCPCYLISLTPQAVCCAIVPAAWPSEHQQQSGLDRWWDSLHIWPWVYPRGHVFPRPWSGSWSSCWEAGIPGGVLHARHACKHSGDAAKQHSGPNVVVRVLQHVTVNIPLTFGSRVTHSCWGCCSSHSAAA